MFGQTGAPTYAKKIFMKSELPVSKSKQNSSEQTNRNSEGLFTSFTRVGSLVFTISIFI
jgi:hypothetical protein